MLNFIKVSNEWYESLTDIKKIIFIITMVIIPNSFILGPKPYCTIAIVFALMICIWRLAFKVLK